MASPLNLPSLQQPGNLAGPCWPLLGPLLVCAPFSYSRTPSPPSRLDERTPPLEMGQGLFSAGGDGVRRGTRMGFGGVGGQEQGQSRKGKQTTNNNSSWPALNRQLGVLQLAVKLVLPSARNTQPWEPWKVTAGDNPASRFMWQNPSPGPPIEASNCHPPPQNPSPWPKKIPHPPGAPPVERSLLAR